MILFLSRSARSLSKEATAVPDIPGLTGSTIVADKYSHGLEGRLSRQGSPGQNRGAKAKKTEGPRAYGPRINGPG